MQFIADLHIHSRFSRATSHELNFPNLCQWACYKGIQVIGTGDFTHPGWLEEIQTYLEPSPEPGLFQIKKTWADHLVQQMPGLRASDVRFLLSVEISSIYKKNDKVRKIHNIVFAPSIEVAQRICYRLGQLGNLKSDGRPILGIDCHDLLDMLLKISPEIYLIPAHIWTPWFALFGSSSGFDHIEECFEDLTPYIFALETGLSSDPAMNWMCSQLDRFTLVSNSDAHSASKLGREANLFDCELSYQGIFNALKTGDPKQFLGTIEFYPEEGKYHFDGHRKCNACLTPEQTMECKGICPVCKKPLTLGVMSRVMQIADRKHGQKPDRVFPFTSLVPLEVILSEILEVGEQSKKLHAYYHHLLNVFGPELEILSKTPLVELEKASKLFAAAIQRVREGHLQIQAGYDGEYGKISIFKPDERAKFEEQSMFAGWDFKEKPLPAAAQISSNPRVKSYDVEESIGYAGQNSEGPNQAPGSIEEAPKFLDSGHSTDPGQSFEFRLALESNRFVDFGIPEEVKKPADPIIGAGEMEFSSIHSKDKVDSQQLEAIQRPASLLIVAGPGSGKTRVLIRRIALFIQRGKAPETVLAITFTNKAADEMKERLQDFLGEQAQKITVCTFHSLGYQILSEFGHCLDLPKNFRVWDDQDCVRMLRLNDPDLIAWLPKIKKSQYNEAEANADDEFLAALTKYRNIKKKCHAIDLDDLLALAVQVLSKEEIAHWYHERFHFIAVDEYQDVNRLQIAMLQALCHKGCVITAIGDPNQAIYGFRGSDPWYFDRFENDFKTDQVIFLSRNYRSSIPIVKAASALMLEHQTTRYDIPVLSSDRQGQNIQTYTASNSQREAEFVAQEIEKLIGGTSHSSMKKRRIEQVPKRSYSFESFGILYRTNAQAADLEAALIHSGMPYQILAKQTFWEKPSILHCIAVLQLMYNTQDDLAVADVLAQTPGLGPRLVDIVHKFSQVLEIPMWNALTQAESAFTQEARTALKFFYERKQNCEKYLSSHSVPETIQYILTQFSEVTLSSEDRQMLMESAASCPTLDIYLSKIRLHSDHDLYNPNVEKISLMTLHSSKGLEFPVVFMVGCEEGLLPYSWESNCMEEDIQEERRLFYVGITRAQQLLYLTHCQYRIIHGKEQRQAPSRFLEEIPNNYKERIAPPETSRKQQKKLF